MGDGRRGLGGKPFGAMLALLLAGCTPTVDTVEACALVRKAELPVQFHGNEPVVEIKLNGQKARMILDTGADATYVFQEAADRLHLVAASTKSSYSFGVAGFDMGYLARVENAEIAQGLTLAGRLNVAGHILAGEEKIDGLLGREAVQDFDLDVDFPNDRVVLYRGRNCPSHKPYMGLDAEELPRPDVVVGGALPGNVITIEIDGSPNSAMIDTGATSSLISYSTAAVLGLNEPILRHDVRLRGSDTLGWPIFLAAHKFKTLKVGSTVTQSPVLPVALAPSPYNTSTFGILLGNDYLRLHRVWLSFASGRTYATYSH